MIHPLVSIIIPCYNAEKHVAEAIQSALDQTYSNKEVIVIDDGSTDSSLEIIRSFGDKIHWETGPNLGGNRARNRGLALSKGDFIKFLDADDTLFKTCIEEQVSQAIHLNPMEIPYGIVVDYDSNEIVDLAMNSDSSISTVDMIRVLLSEKLLTSSPLHRRDLLMRIFGFDERLRVWQEWNLHIRLALIGCKFIHFKTTAYSYRCHTSKHRVSCDTKSNYYLRMLLNSILLTTMEIGNSLSPKKDKYISRHIAISITRIANQLARTLSLEEYRNALEFSRRLYPIRYVSIKENGNILSKLKRHVKYLIALKIIPVKILHSIVKNYPTQ